MKCKHTTSTKNCFCWLSTKQNCRLRKISIRYWVNKMTHLRSRCVKIPQISQVYQLNPHFVLSSQPDSLTHNYTILHNATFLGTRITYLTWMLTSGVIIKASCRLVLTDLREWPRTSAPKAYPLFVARLTKAWLFTLPKRKQTGEMNTNACIA